MNKAASSNWMERISVLLPPTLSVSVNERIILSRYASKAKNLKINGKEQHDVISVKDGSVQFGDSKIYDFKRLTVHTDKNHSYVETNIPEFGSRSRIGMFAGPGFVFDAPFGSTIKVMPL